MKSEIEWIIERFISGTDCSIDAANKIESALDDSFPDDDYVQQTIEMLAMYRPEGGEFLFDRTAIRQRLIDTIVHLRAQ
jgi:hypothetical protein